MYAFVVLRVYSCQLLVDKLSLAIHFDTAHATSGREDTSCCHRLSRNAYRPDVYSFPITPEFMFFVLLFFFPPTTFKMSLRAGRFFHGRFINGQCGYAYEYAKKKKNPPERPCLNNDTMGIRPAAGFNYSFDFSRPSQCVRSIIMGRFFSFLLCPASTILNWSLNKRPTFPLAKGYCDSCGCRIIIQNICIEYAINNVFRYPYCNTFELT